MERYLTVLRSFKRMPNELTEALRENVRMREVPKKEVIQPVGMITDKLYFVERGLFRLYQIRGNGEEVIMRFKKQDEFIIALKGIYSNKDAGDGIQALENSTIWEFSGDFIQQAIRKYKEFLMQNTIIMLADAKAIQEAIRCSQTGRPPENYDMLRKYSPDLLDRVPVRYLANYTDMSESRFRRLHSASGLKTVAKRRRNDS